MISIVILLVGRLPVIPPHIQPAGESYFVATRTQNRALGCRFEPKEFTSFSQPGSLVTCMAYSTSKLSSAAETLLSLRTFRTCLISHRTGGGRPGHKTQTMEFTNRKYAPLWNKYRPVILKLMVDAATSPQQYKLAYHELQSMDNKKNGFGFSMVISGSKTVTNIKDSEIAKDLLNMLQLSPKGMELMALHSYKITLHRNFVLSVDQVVQEITVN